jgi:hypothetical protein
MAWTEITRRHYRRDGLRYESDTTDAGVVCDGAASAACFGARASTCNRHANGDKCDPLHCVHRLPMAAVAEGLPTLLDGAGLFLCLVARRTLRFTELHSRHGLA